MRERSGFWTAWSWAAIALLLLFACHLENPSPSGSTFSFPTLKDKIGEADHVTIRLEDSSGHTVDVLFNGPVDSTTTFTDLKAIHYEGGKVFIHIEARKGEEVVYKTTRGYDPAKGGDLERQVEVDLSGKARDSLRLMPDSLTLALRGPTGRFVVHFVPARASEEVLWSTLDPSFLDVSMEGVLTARAVGRARVVAVTKTVPSLADTAWVRILPELAVDSLRFDRRFVDLFVQGSSDSPLVRVYPPLAPPGVVLLVGDSSVASLAGGLLRGLKEGETWLWARSVANPRKQDSIPLTVFPAAQVDSVRLKEDTVRLYVNGESRALTARLYPLTLKPYFAWESEEEAVARVDAEGQVTPVGAGTTRIVVKARADSSQRDQVLVVVKLDVPHLRVGGDTVIARGTTLTYDPLVVQEYGVVEQFKWDLDGNGVFEDSSATLPSGLTYRYGEAREYKVRFYLRDTEGNDTVHIRLVKAVEGRVVQILVPRDGSFTKEPSLAVTWNLDGESRTSTERLAPGANTIVRSAQDSAGNVYADTVLVYLDQSAPPRPVVLGPQGPVKTLTPRWSWRSGDTSKAPGRGAGIYRLRLDDPELGAATQTTDTVYTPPTNLFAGTHTLYVQERDEAGNWSPSGSHAVVVDTTAPPPPSLSVVPESPTNNPRPTWSWSSGSGDGAGAYRYKLDDGDFRTGAKDTTGNKFQPAVPLSEGVHSLYVQERDSAGNWSVAASKAISIDLTPPAPPTVSVGPAMLTNDATPTWSWTTSTVGTVIFRWRLDSADWTTGGAEGTGRDYTPASGLAEGVHTLDVQEKDAAGNWSLSGSRQVRIDVTPPTPPRIDSTPYSPLNSLRPRWTWRSGTGGAKVYRARVDTADLTGAVERTDSVFMPKGDLTEDSHVLYAQERDSAGNWSKSASRSITTAISGFVGSITFSAGASDRVSLILDDADVPIIAYSDQGLGNKICVKRFLGGTWMDVGIPQADSGNRVSLAKGANGTILMAFSDMSRQGQATVKLFDGNVWQHLGGPGITNSGVRKIKIAFGQADTPTLFAYTYSDEINILQFDGSGWNVLGSREDFPATKPYYYAVGFGMSRKGIPYVASIDGSQAAIFRHRDGKWAKVGPTFQAGMYDMSFGFTELDEPVVAFGDQQRNDTVEARIFSGSSWNLIGSGSKANGLIGHEGFATGSGNTTYIAFPRKSQVAPLVIFKVNIKSEEWREMSGPANSIGELDGSYLSLAVSRNGVPYVAYINGALGNKVSVVKTSFNETR